jgi:Plectin/S10 domain
LPAAAASTAAALTTHLRLCFHAADAAAGAAAAAASRQYYYYYLTPAGIEYLREYLHLPEETIPATLKKPAARPARAGPTPGERHTACICVLAHLLESSAVGAAGVLRSARGAERRDMVLCAASQLRLMHAPAVFRAILF